MKRLRVTLIASFAVLATVLATSLPAAAAGGHFTGTLDGAKYIIDVPSNWNGTLVLYSHGYTLPEVELTAFDAPNDGATGPWLLANGYALAGSSYSQNGWALKEAFHDQIALLDYFKANFAGLKRTIAWGHSLGGMITAGLIQLFPDRFAGAIPMCGVVAGGPGVWNSALDAEFVFKTLLAPNSGLQLVNLSNPNPFTSANLGLAESILSAANGTAAGRARTALVAAVGDSPGWFTTGAPQPAQTDYAAREQNQMLWDQNVTFPFVFALRGELEARAGGNPSWNTGVNYVADLAKSADLKEVIALYKAAGLSLGKDLQTLNSAKRIKANPNAEAYLIKNISFNGRISVPVLTMHTTGDGLVVPENEQAYRSAVDQAGRASLLRQVFVHRAGHCTFTPAETVTAVQTLENRLATGRWHVPSPAAMNAQAAALGPQLNIFTGGVATPPAFIRYSPAVYLRPFNLVPRF